MFPMCDTSLVTDESFQDWDCVLAREVDLDCPFPVPQSLGALGGSGNLLRVPEPKTGLEISGRCSRCRVSNLFPSTTGHLQLKLVTP